MKHLSKFGLGPLSALSAAVLALVAGCSSPPPPRPTPPIVQPPAPVPPPLVSIEPDPFEFVTIRSEATTPRDYRRDAAKHLYGKNSHRIFKGKMPPLLYAVGVLQIEVDKKGHVAGTQWMRSPNHAPEVVAEIERTVRNAAPYPAPVLMGRVTYTDTWLWHKSGRFQLDTLTEGQM
jgi:protein TonB